MLYASKHLLMDDVFGSSEEPNIDFEKTKKLRDDFNHNLSMSHYTELERPEAPSGYVLIERIDIDLNADVTMPSKVLAIYCHNQDLDYAQVFKDD